MPDNISNALLDADDCSNCGATWKRCLEGWPESNAHPMGVCCGTCHNTDTHNADAARVRYRRAQLEAEVPSGDALDRATKFVIDHDLRPGLVRELVVDIAKLIDRADAAAVTEVKPREEYLGDAMSRIQSNNRTQADHLESAVKLLRSRPAVGLLASAIAELEWFGWRCDGQRVDMNTMQERLDARLEQARQFRRDQEQTAAERDAAQAALREAVRGRLTVATTDALLE
jgi:hypothetical protein